MPSAALYVVKFTFLYGFESYSAHHLFNNLRTAIGSQDGSPKTLSANLLLVAVNSESDVVPYVSIVIARLE